MLTRKKEAYAQWASFGLFETRHTQGYVSWNHNSVIDSDTRMRANAYLFNKNTGTHHTITFRNADRSTVLVAIASLRYTESP
jgi:hypothetical protein